MSATPDAMSHQTAPGFQHLQWAFAGYIRDPGHTECPEGVSETAMSVYRELFFNNILGALNNAFPVLSGLYGEDAWGRLVERFFAQHRCRSPYFTRLPYEFLHYLQYGYEPCESDPTFLLELAHYEWVELALAIADESPECCSPRNTADPIATRLWLSPLAWPLCYRFPVHRLGPDYRPTEPPPHPTHLAVYRNQQDEVRFLELTPASARLLQLIGKAPGRCAGELLSQIGEELGQPDSPALIAGGTSLIGEMLASGILLPTEPCQGEES